MAWVVVPETSKLILDKAKIPYPCLLYLFGRPAPPPSYDMGCSITTNQCLCCRGRVETEKDQPNQNMTIKLFWFPWLSHAKWILLQHPLESRQDVATIWHMSYFLWQISRDLHWKICIADCMRYVQDFFLNLHSTILKHKGHFDSIPPQKYAQTVVQHFGFYM